MTLIIYTLAMYCAIVGLLVSAMKAASKKGKLAYIIKFLEIFGAMALLCASIYTGTSNTRLAYVTRAIFFTLSNVIALFLLSYAMVYVGIKYRSKILQILFVLITALDSGSMIANIWTGHAYKLRPELKLEDGVFLRVVDKTGFYYLHMALFYSVILFVFGIFLYKLHWASKFYKHKYAGIFSGFVIANAANLLVMGLGLQIDISLIFYGVAGIMIAFYSLEYVPNGLMENTLSLIIEEMNHAVLCFDEEGKCNFANEMARRLFAAEKEELESFNRYYMKWKTQFFGEEPEEYHWEETKVINGKNYYLENSFHHIYDEEDNVIGCYFVLADKTHEVEQYERERYRATHDPLTGLYNRQRFFEEAETLLQEHPEREYCVLCSNVKDFKLINDLFGTERGNEVLRMQATMLEDRCDDKCIYGRLMSDRFALCMPREYYDEQMFIEAMRYLSKSFANNVFRVQFQVGVYDVKDRSENASIMCDKATIAMESITDESQCPIAYYSNEVLENNLKEKRMINEFERAIENEEFCIHLQPQTDAEGEVLGAEALVRWEHPELGLLYPGYFIDTFEKTGLIHRLDEYVWEKAIMQLADWKRQGIEKYHISVNISTKDFYFLDVYKTITSLVEKYDVHPKYLKLEITETALMTELEQNLALIDKLQKYGFQIEIDDFGSGYSSLNMLKDIHADILKIDMGFLRETENKERSRDILSSMITLSQKLGMPVITEGVETEDQLKMLTDMGCDMFQGYYFAKPMAITQFEQRYAEVV